MGIPPRRTSQPHNPTRRSPAPFRVAVYCTFMSVFTHEPKGLLGCFSKRANYIIRRSIVSSDPERFRRPVCSVARRTTGLLLVCTMPVSAVPAAVKVIA